MRAAAMTHIAVYQLGIGDICGQQVAALLKGNVFMYEGHWGLDGKEVCVYQRVHSPSHWIMTSGGMGHQAALGLPQPRNR